MASKPPAPTLHASQGSRLVGLFYARRLCPVRVQSVHLYTEKKNRLAPLGSSAHSTFHIQATGQAQTTGQASSLHLP